MTYKIYHPENPNSFFEFDKNFGGVQTVSEVNEKNRTELKTFGRLPYVYYAGETDYQVFDLSTVLLSSERDDASVDTPASKFYVQLKRLIRRREPLVVETPLGEKLLCDVSLNPTNIPYGYNDEYFNYLEISVHCVEVGEVE